MAIKQSSNEKDLNNTFYESKFAHQIKQFE